MIYMIVHITILSLIASTFSLQIHPRHGHNDSKRIARALDVNANAIFPTPQQLEKRGLLIPIVDGVLDPVVTVVGDVTGLVATVLGEDGQSLTTTFEEPPIVVPTTSSARTESPPPVTSSTVDNGNDGNDSDDGNNGSSPGSSSAPSNDNGENSPENPNTSANTSQNGSSGSTASASTGGNLQSGGSNTSNDAVVTGTFPVVVTNHNGQTITATGTGAITLTYLTTLPNGVVSTVTEVITPTPIEGTSPPSERNLNGAKIAAIVGTVVFVFLLIFGITVCFLIARKRRRAQQMANSNRDSSLSFDTSDAIHNDQHALLHASASTASFRTAPTFIDGSNREFPLPPVPSATGNSSSNNQGTSSSGRPNSTYSFGTFDLMERRSRSSLIADRNFYAKMGQYPTAGTYTPFVLPPSSEFNPSEEGHNGRLSPTELTTALQRTKSVKSFHEVWRGSKVIDTSQPLPVSENPFNDPSTITQPAPAAMTSTSVNLFANPEGRRTSLWRKTTFGSTRGVQPSIQEALDSTSDSHLYTTADSSFSPKSSNRSRPDSFAANRQTLSPGRHTVISLESIEYETADEALSRRTSESYHSAVAKYGSSEGDNPFADRNGSMVGSRRESNGKESGSGSGRCERVMSTGRRPATAKSTAEASVISSVAHSSDGNRDLSTIPDPKDLFYRPPSTGYSDRPSTAGDRPMTGNDRPLSAQSGTMGRLSEESGHGTSEGEKTIKHGRISYPSLGGMADRMHGTVSTWRPATTR